MGFDDIVLSNGCEMSSIYNHGMITELRLLRDLSPTALILDFHLIYSLILTLNLSGELNFVI